MEARILTNLSKFFSSKGRMGKKGDGHYSGRLRKERSREGEQRGGRRLDPALTRARTRAPFDLEATEN